MSTELGAGGRFDIFLDSAHATHLVYRPTSFFKLHFYEYIITTPNTNLTVRQFAFGLFTNLNKKILIIMKISNIYA